MKQLGIAVILFTVWGIQPMATQAQAPLASPEQFAACARACADCQLMCDRCFHHCSTLVAKGAKDHVQRMRLCLDCAECCKMASSLTARHSAFSVGACAFCATCCNE